MIQFYLFYFFAYRWFFIINMTEQLCSIGMSCNSDLNKELIRKAIILECHRRRVSNSVKNSTSIASVAPR